jgi:protein-L-isoaspartate O-methyltransferase
MINKQILLDKLVTNNVQGIFGINLTEEIILNNYSIKNRYGINYIELRNPDNKLLAVDSPDYITEFCSELLNIEFNSILVGGLGTGNIPYVCQDFAQVDVIENDQNIINITSQLNHLRENVNIINGDIFTFEPTKTYDIIIMDIWYNSIPEDVTENIISKYLPCLNEGGFLYLPLNQYDNPTKVKIN